MSSRLPVRARRRRCSSTRPTAGGTPASAFAGLPGRHPCRRLFWLQRAVRRKPGRRGRLPGTRPVQILRRPRCDRPADRQESARPHRRRRSRAYRPPSAEVDARSVRSRSLRRCATRPFRNCPQVQTRQSLPLNALALDGTDPLLRRRPCRPSKQSGRARPAFGRKNYLFAGSDAGGRSAAAMY